MTKDKKNYIKGFALTGAEAKNVENKKFVIVSEPQYTEYEDPNTNQVKETLLCKIEFNGAIVDYYPNKTSCGVILAEKGRDLKNWIGYTGEFEIENQKIGKVMKDVIYIKVPEQ